MAAKKSILYFFQNDWHFLLLIIFFITHGYAENVKLVPVAELLLLLLAIIAGGLLLFWLCRKIFKSRERAAVFLTFFLAVFFFFGAFQDFFGGYKSTSFIAQLKIFFPACLVLILLVFILLKRSRGSFLRLRIFLNVLFLLYITIDVVTIGVKLLSPGTPKQISGLANCDTCAKPSIYFILMDEYSGTDGLKSYFNYDNTSFENFLEAQGFKVNRHALSNYVFTVFSLASTLNMEYLKDLGVQSAQNHYGYRKATAHIGDNIVTRFLRQQGYQVNNFSYFALPGAPAKFRSDYLPGKLSLITHKTMYSRVIKELMIVLASRYSISYFQEKSDAFYINNNETIMRRALEQPAATPSFNYLHLMMPHYPFAYDSMGRRITPFWKRKSFTMKDVDEAYLQYLGYTNKRMEKFIAELKQRTNGNAIIILLSDHGYRTNDPKIDNKFHYQIFNAVYLPGKNYNAWYDGMSNVNEFRALFNTSFGQKLPMLKDSLIP
jgi:hypothetical protein